MPPPLDGFLEWLSSARGLSFPNDGEPKYSFGALFAEFLEGLEAYDFNAARTLRRHLVFAEGELRWMRVEVLTTVPRETAGPAIAELVAAYDRYVEALNSEVKASEGKCAISRVIESLLALSIRTEHFLSSMFDYALRTLIMLSATTSYWANILRVLSPETCLVDHGAFQLN